MKKGLCQSIIIAGFIVVAFSSPANGSDSDSLKDSLDAFSDLNIQRDQIQKLLESNKGDLRYEQAVLQDLRDKYRDAKSGGYTEAMDKYTGRMREQEKRVGSLLQQGTLLLGNADKFDDAIHGATVKFIGDNIKDKRERLERLERGLGGDKFDTRASLRAEITAGEQDMEKVKERGATRKDAKGVLDLFTGAGAPSSESPKDSAKPTEGKKSEGDARPTSPPSRAELKIISRQEMIDSWQKSIGYYEKTWLPGEEDYLKTLESSAQANRERGYEDSARRMEKEAKELKETIRGVRKSVDYERRLVKDLSDEIDNIKAEEERKNKRGADSTSAFDNTDAINRGGLGAIMGSGSTPTAGLDGAPSSRDIESSFEKTSDKTKQDSD